MRRKSRGFPKSASAIVDPGATRTDMRARAYPGEDPETVKPPEVVGDRIAELLVRRFPQSVTAKEWKRRVNHSGLASC